MPLLFQLLCVNDVTIKVNCITTQPSIHSIFNLYDLIFST